ncbi:MAG TPA: hypothetical protein VJ020_09815 [Anaerolineales bacterium]|nr:hypothetical protein [Anaerolineales bacterium]
MAAYANCQRKRRDLLIDYGKPPPPPKLCDEDAGRVDDFVKEKRAGQL